MFERLHLPNAFRDAALLAPGRCAARSFVRPSAVSLDAALLRPRASSPSGAMPVVSNSVFVGTATDPVVLEQEPNDDEAHAQMVKPPCDITGTFAPRGDNDVFRFEGRRARSGGWKLWRSGSARWPTPRS